MVVERRKLTKEELKELAQEYHSTDHEGKRRLATQYGYTLDTLKHKISDAGLGQPKAKAPEPHNYLTQTELLDTRPSVHLDFVSFDLETSNLSADFSIVLTACIKPYGLAPVCFRADDYPTWTTNRSDDKQIVQGIADELRKHAIVMTHYGTRFDTPFLRAKMVKYALEPLPPMFAIDSWRIAKDNFAVSSRRLKNLAAYFDIGDKEGVEGGLWMSAAYSGNSSALDKIMEHNVKDVEILEKLACLSFPYLKFIRRL